jgi:hypothetical protein
MKYVSGMITFGTRGGKKVVFFSKFCKFGEKHSFEVLDVKKDKSG